MKTKIFSNKITNPTLLPDWGEGARRADEGRSNRRRSLTFILCVLSLTALTGCGGGGGGENRAPINTVGGLIVEGVVSVRVTTARAASLDEETLVPGATVAFSVEGDDVVLSRTISDLQGKFRLPIRPGTRGRITVVKENRQLSAIVVSGSGTNGVVERNVNLESTVVERALRNLNTLSYDVKAMEEAVRIGEAPELLNEVRTAFAENRSPQPSATALADGLTRLITGEANATRDCLSGQEWCVVTGTIQSGAQAGTYSSRVLLRRDRTDANNVATTTATIGAGYVTLRLPAGVTVTGMTGATVQGEAVLLEGSLLPDGGNLYQISILHDSIAGIGEAAKLLDINLSSTRTLGEEDRVVVVTQKLLGTLNERRGGTARAAQGVAASAPDLNL